MWHHIIGFVVMIDWLISTHLIARLRWCFLKCFRIPLSITSWSFIPRESFLHPFCSSGSTFSERWGYTFPTKTQVRRFHINARHAIGKHTLSYHVGTSPTTTQVWRFSVNLEYNIEILLNQYLWTQSGPGPFQLFIFFIAVFTFSTLILIFSSFSVSLNLSFTLGCHEAFSLKFPGFDQVFLQNSEATWASRTSFGMLLRASGSW